MRLNSITPKITFNGNDRRNNISKVYTACAIAGVLSGGVAYKCAHDSLEESRERINKIFDRAELANDLYQVKQDTFALKDITNDGIPELLLYKNDGSVLILDIKDSKKLTR